MRFGPPDNMETGPKPRPIDEGEGDGYPYEDWHYAHLEEIGEDVSLEFVDKCLCGDYKMIPNKAINALSPDDIWHDATESFGISSK